MLCIGVALVFAGASAASVVDRFEHQNHLAHEHGLHFAVHADDDHDGDHHPPSHHHDGDRDAGDHQPGAGHHHSDAPTGLFSAPPTSSTVVAVAGVVTRPTPGSRIFGLKPGGLERPPKGAANLV